MSTDLPPQACATTVDLSGTPFCCDTLDRCDASQETIPVRLACCDVDPTLCDAPPPGLCEVTGGTEVEDPPEDEAESCMACHNGSPHNDYAGDGMSNPHPFGASAQYLRCTTCHGGVPDGGGWLGSHVPRPPQLGDDQRLQVDAVAYFNYLTRTGLDAYPDWNDPTTGRTWTALDYLQFLNPGDLRVVTQARGCGAGGCHAGEHASWVPRSPIAQEQGIYSATLFTAGAPNAVPAQRGLYTETASDYAFRPTSDPSWVYDPSPTSIGRVGELLQFPEKAVYGQGGGFYDSFLYDSTTLATFRYVDNDAQGYANQVIAGSPLEDVVIEAVAIQCGDCHAGSSGANNRYGDFRSSGCTACHMRYTLDGVSASTDPNVPRDEPANPDAIAAPERPHVYSHQVANVAKYYPTANGPTFVSGVTDQACVGCHQGSNRTVLQYWGIRLDQNQDVVRGVQYPLQPVTFSTTAGDPRLYQTGVGNATFNGRVPEQYLLLEDYDGDGRDDTPPDVHYEAGLGCIDCHGSRDLHNGTAGDPTSGGIWSRMDQTVGVACESCHGTIDARPDTVACLDYDGNAATCAADRFGNALRNVTVDGLGRMVLRSRITSATHLVPQTLDTVQDNGVVDADGHPVYSPAAAYAMGRYTGGTDGPIQGNANVLGVGFAHTDTLACDACHASWSNNCIGCHLQLQYDDDPLNVFVSNTTGQRIALAVTNADFTYINPVWFTLEVSTRGKVGAGQPGMKAFWRYVDQQGVLAKGITFSDRNGSGNTPDYLGRDPLPALSHNRIYAHSIRGRVTPTEEGARQCVACHLNVDQLATWGDGYQAFFDAMAANDFDAVDFPLLAEHVGANPGNQLNSPYFVHMAAGLGTGLLLFDADGCPVNPLDADTNRAYCEGVAPANRFDLDQARYDLDSVVEAFGAANSSHTRPLLDPGAGPRLRVGAQDPSLAGPLGAELLSRLADPATPLVLDGWIDADGVPHGVAAAYVP
ncbi:MAG: hypothetical protein R3F59_00170 [Myxococcota bacterium]